MKELALRSEKQINWYHIGIKIDSFNQKYNISNDKISNLKIMPLGIVSNEDLIEKYKEISPNIFINYSSTEGIPVSIMEALSCAIPVFATDVGGNSEIVDSSVGRLVDPNLSIEDTVDELIKLINDLDTEPLQRNAYLRWKEDYNAEKNYSQHARFLKSNLIKS
jgi:glycosyltransferase involved in cell wall biosynthesis